MSTVGILVIAWDYHTLGAASPTGRRTAERRSPETDGVIGQASFDTMNHFDQGQLSVGDAFNRRDWCSKVPDPLEDVLRITSAHGAVDPSLSEVERGLRRHKDEDGVVGTGMVS